MFAPLAACGQEGPQGLPGANGTNADGTTAGAGANGAVGGNGANGTNGTAGPAGPEGPAGAPGAAGAAAVNPSTETSGARIKARYSTYTYAGADGAKQTIKGFGGWYDSQRLEACSVMLASDGARRCLPPGTGTIGYMADAACTKPVVTVASGAMAPKYATNYVPIAEGSGLRLVTVGAKLALASWYVSSGASCIAVGAPSAGTDIYDASAVEIAPTTFVAFTFTTVTM